MAELQSVPLASWQQCFCQKINASLLACLPPESRTAIGGFCRYSQQTNGTEILGKFMFPYNITLGCFCSCTSYMPTHCKTAPHRRYVRHPSGADAHRTPHTVECHSSTPGETLTGRQAKEEREMEVRRSTSKVEGSRNTTVAPTVAVQYN
jgi:hypothetical protein